MAELLRHTGLAEPEKADRSNLYLESLESLESLCRISNPTIGGRTDRSVLEDYVGRLSCGEVRGLYQRYLPDFVMFQYGIDHILDIANKGHGC